MRKISVKIVSLSFAAALIFAFSGCDNGSSAAQETTVAATTSATVETTAPSEEKTLENLHSYTENRDDFAGAWSITDGSGSQLESFVYIFSGDGEADLVTGTTGYISTYLVDSKKKEFMCQLMYGINGTYTYEKDGDNKIVLTNTSSSDTTTLTRLDNFSAIPESDGKAKIDSKLVGAWKSESGEYYYFGEDGIMYQNQFSMTFTYYTYSADGGKITAVSDMGVGNQDSEFSYSVNGDTLTLDGYEYSRISVSELL